MNQLASPDEPLILADGTKIDPRTGNVIREQKFIEIPRHSDAQRMITNAKKRVSDLPLPPKQMNAISVVLSYTLFGLSDFEIAMATGMTEQQIGQMKLLDAFTSMYDSVVQTIVEQDIDDVRQMFVRHSKTAATKMVELADSENEATALAAAKDILDRAGHRPADVVEHRHRMEGGLTIEVVRKDHTIDIPTINVIDGDEE